MNIQSMLEQLLATATRPGGSQDVNDASRGQSASPDWGKYATGGAVGGALALLLGSKGGRKLGGKALQYGSVAALGALAVKAYTNWQEMQAAQTGQAPVAAAPAPQQLAAPSVDQRTRALLKAMIGAAKADGHLDERERGLVEAELLRLDADPGVRQWFEEEMRRPLDPVEVAQSARTPELASEMYLASLLMVDETSFMERAYLDELARQLRLPRDLQAQLEAQMTSTQAA